MQRVKKHKYGHDAQTVGATQSTHVVKIGWKGKSAQGKEIPIRLVGFLLCRDSVGANDRYEIDYDAMARLGFVKAVVDNAIAVGWKATLGNLPDTLRFVVMADAMRVNDSQLYPGICTSSYECYNEAGLFCQGDGENATRKMPDGTRRILPCVPYGKTGSDPATFCEFSGPGKPRKPCNMHFRLSLCLLTTDGTRPLWPELGMQARARLDSSMGLAEPQIMATLDRAANRLGGLLSGITGRLIFRKKRARTGDGGVITSNIQFLLDEEAILGRLRMMRQAKDTRLIAGPEGAEYGNSNGTSRALALGDPEDVVVDDPASGFKNVAPIGFALDLRRIPVPDPTPAPTPMDLACGAGAFLTNAAIYTTPADVAAVLPDDPDDDLFDDQPESAPAPSGHAAEIDAAPVAHLAAILQSYLSAVSEARGNSISYVIQELALAIEPRVKKQLAHMLDAAWFTGGVGVGADLRQKLLRDICKKIDAENDPFFAFVYLSPEAKNEEA